MKKMRPRPGDRVRIGRAGSQIEGTLMLRRGPRLVSVRWDSHGGMTQVDPKNLTVVNRLETGRRCAVCGKTTAPSSRKDTYGFHTILGRAGIDGDKAHPECVAAIDWNTSARPPRGQALVSITRAEEGEDDV